MEVPNWKGAGILIKKEFSEVKLRNSFPFSKQRELRVQRINGRRDQNVSFFVLTQRLTFDGAKLKGTKYLGLTLSNNRF